MFAPELKSWLLPEPTAAACSPRQRALAAPYMTAASRRERLAHDLSSQPSPIESALLLRDAVVLLTRAAFAARSTTADEARLSTLDTASTLADLRRAVGRDASADARRVDQAISSTDPLYFDSLDEGELRLTYDALALEAASLRELTDLRTPAYLAGTRVGRLAAIGLVLCYLVYAVSGRLWRPKNLALGKPVRLSSQEPGTPDPSGLVDGNRGKTFGAHTRVSVRPGWAIIDLEHDASLKKVVVYNRGDSNLNDGLPYFIDFSSDGEAWREVARRDAPFGDGGFMSEPWSATVRDHARYVRIRATWYLALSEVEVF